MKAKIAIVTPLKDELNNLDRLIESISNQSINIHTWVIIENDSIDGSREYLNKINSIKNVENLFILNLDTNQQTYELGKKYSSIVHKGFELIKSKKNIYDELNFIGILDADCFPDKDYYQVLTNFMKVNPRTGISSGIILFDDGKKHKTKRNHVRGSGRLWSIDCFRDVGYVIGMSADSLSSAKAVIKGWQVNVCEKAIIKSRVAGAIKGFSYYGESAYYRGNSLLYAFLKSIK
jgi:glycosyltransferase involved in cell wall biosynthesis